MAVPLDFSALLDQLWAQHRDRTLSRLQVVESAIASADPAVRAHGAAEAHKLAGALGSFGLPQATEAARSLEASLLQDPPPEEDLRQNFETLRQAIVSR